MESIIFQHGSALIGGLAVLSVCVVFIKRGAFEKSGFGLLICGTTLICLPLWSQAKFVWDSQGLQVDIQGVARQLETLETKINTSINTSNDMNGQVRRELVKLSKEVETVQTSNNLALATLASNPQLSTASSSLVRAYSSLARGNDDTDVEKIIDNPQQAISILQNTEELTRKLSEKIQAQQSTQ